jgi:O-antigen ligase
MHKAQEWAVWGYEWFAQIFIWLVFAALIIMMPADSPGQTKWTLIAILSAGLISEILIREKLGIAAQLLFVYCVANAAWFGIYKFNRYQFLCVADVYSGKCILDEQGRGMLDVYSQQAIKMFAMDGLAKLLLVIVPLMLFLENRERLRFWGSRLAAAFCGVDVLMVFYAFFFEPKWCQVVNTCGGSLSNPSMNSSMIVATLPFLIKHTGGKVRWIALALAVGSVFLSKGSIGIGLLCALAVLYAIRFKWWKLLALAPLPLAVGAFQMPLNLLFNSGNRFNAWEFLMGAWAKRPINYPFGTGYGTFGVFSANLQVSSGKFQNDWWIWLHNDWLEVLFTLGVVGLVLALLVYASALWRLYCRGEHTETISLCLFGLVMGCNYPAHQPISALFGAWIVLLGLLKTTNKDAEIVLSRHNC